MTVSPWAYSRIKDFKTCPKQFYHKHVLKEIPFKATPETELGNEFHKAAELYIRDQEPLDERFTFAAPLLDALAAKPGDKHCEYKFGLTRDLEPCGFFDKQRVWFRGVIDLVIVDGDSAFIVDYKTGKNKYVDTGQLELMALGTFKHFPQVKKVRAALIFVYNPLMEKQTYTVEQEGDMWAKWLGEYAAMEAADKSGVWNPKPSGLCRRHCPVTECVHNGANQ